jgi:ketosteroid isomerase-like protein
MCAMNEAPGDRDAILDAARRMAAAIGRRDRAAVRALVVDAFVQRTIGGVAVDIERFLAAIEQIPGEILSVDLAELEVDVDGDHAIVTGLQHARVRVDGKVIDDKRPFVDWMVKRGGAWRFRAAIDLPGASGPA